MGAVLRQRGRKHGSAAPIQQVALHSLIWWAIRPGASIGYNIFESGDILSAQT